MSFEEDLAAAQDVEAPRIDVDVLVNKKLYTLRFRQMDGLEWASEVDRHPARPGVMLDARYGYNLRSLVKGAAPKCGVRVDGDAELPLRVDPFVKGSQTARVDEWALVLKAISGHDFQRITDAIWALNEKFPEDAVKAAKKALSDSLGNSD